MGELIYDLCGGLKPGRKLKAVIPGGSSAKVLRAGEKYKLKDQRSRRSRTCPMDFDTLAAAGSMAGSGGVIVMDDSRDMVEMLNNINDFYAHESCGQCTPCREGSLWMKKITDRMLAGGGTARDPDHPETAWPITSPARPSAPLAKPAPGRCRASWRNSAKSLWRNPPKRSPRRCRPSTTPMNLSDTPSSRLCLHRAATGPRSWPLPPPGSSSSG